MQKTKTDEMSGIDEKIAKLKARKTLLKQKQDKQERKDRTHRLCRRGGYVEGRLSGLTRLTDEDFEIYVEKVMLTPFAKKVLAELAPPPPDEPEDGSDNAQDGGTGATEPANEAARHVAAPTPKPAQTATAPHGADGGKTGDAAGTGG